MLTAGQRKSLVICHTQCIELDRQVPDLAKGHRVLLGVNRKERRRHCYPQDKAGDAARNEAVSNVVHPT